MLFQPFYLREYLVSSNSKCTVPTDQNCHARRVVSLENAISRDAQVHNIVQASYERLKKIFRGFNSRIIFSRCCCHLLSHAITWVIAGDSTTILAQGTRGMHPQHRQPSQMRGVIISLDFCNNFYFGTAGIVVSQA